jgi:hypothetical protein
VTNKPPSTRLRQAVAVDRADPVVPSVESYAASAPSDRVSLSQRGTATTAAGDVGGEFRLEPHAVPRSQHHRGVSASHWQDSQTDTKAYAIASTRSVETLRAAVTAP